MSGKEHSKRQRWGVYTGGIATAWSPLKNRSTMVVNL